YSGVLKDAHSNVLTHVDDRGSRLPPGLVSGHVPAKDRQIRRSLSGRLCQVRELPITPLGPSPLPHFKHNPSQLPGIGVCGKIRSSSVPGYCPSQPAGIDYADRPVTLSTVEVGVTGLELQRIPLQPAAQHGAVVPTPIPVQPGDGLI